MPTLKQIEANRLNAQHSTGPRSEEGKRASSQNALKSGLDAETQFVIGESREDFAQLQSEWYDYHAPVNPEERLQVDTIVRSEWFLRRYFRIEAQLWEYHSKEAQRGTGFELGEAFSKASLIFMRFQRRILLAEKSGKEARAELDRLKALRQPQQTKTETQQLGSFLTTPIDPKLEFAQLEPLLREKPANSGIVDPSPVQEGSLISC
jgi:hypothetical protein